MLRPILLLATHSDIELGNTQAHSLKMCGYGTCGRRPRYDCEWHYSLDTAILSSAGTITSATSFDDLQASLRYECHRSDLLIEAATHPSFATTAVRMMLVFYDSDLHNNVLLGNLVLIFRRNPPFFRNYCLPNFINNL
jgi:hypothetical protein